MVDNKREKWREMSTPTWNLSLEHRTSAAYRPQMTRARRPQTIGKEEVRNKRTITKLHL